MKVNFKNKVVLVTGSTRNIGKCIAEHFAKEGAMVIINSRHQKDISKTIREFKKKGYLCFGAMADVSRIKDTKMMINKIVNRWGRIDILVNNAASGESMAAENISERLWKRTLDVNLTGVFNCCQSVFSIMKKQGGGKIINIGSDVVKTTTLMNASYVSSKAGIIGLTRQLASEWGPFHININIVSTSLVGNPERYKFDKKYRYYSKKVISLTPLRRLAKPKDIANLVLFLASERADFITSQIISVNGGLIFN